MEGSPSIDGSHRPKRASRACQRCHSRKVRCDATVNGFPCTNCRLDAVSCQAFSGRRGRRKELAMARAHAMANGTGKELLPSRAASQRAGRASSPEEGEGIHPVPLAYSQYPFIQPIAVDRLERSKALFIETQGCLSLPQKSEVDAFIRHYFLYVHPFAPLFDEAAFCRAYHDGRPGSTQISLTVFRAMMFSASCFVPEEVVKRCGYASLLDARDDLYEKAKLLYESGVEDDPLALSTAALLLTYYCSDFEVYANSEWLRVAIKQAGIAQARQAESEDHRATTLGSELKRVWWCCLIRDRIISLGMRRPIQITAAHLELYPPMLTRRDMHDEILHSMVYKEQVKSGLFELLVGLCRLVTIITDLLEVAYPGPPTDSKMPVQLNDLNELDNLKSPLIFWELDWMTHMDGKNFKLHASIPLFAGLLGIYYQSARVALCNRVCLVLNEIADYTTGNIQKLAFCRSELVAAIRSIADSVRKLISIKAIDKLPISVAAYTTTPYILLSIDSQTCWRDVGQNQDTLVLFSAVNRSLGLRYHVTRVSNLITRALWVSRLLKGTQPGVHGKLQTKAGNSHHWNIFTLPLQQYSRLLQYIDHSMSIPQNSEQETGVLYTAVSRPWGSGLECIPEEPDTSRAERELTPVWMEAMENFFCGPGRLLSLPSSSAVEEPEASSSTAIYERPIPLSNIDLPGGVDACLSFLGE